MRYDYHPLDLNQVFSILGITIISTVSIIVAIIIIVINILIFVITIFHHHY